MVNQERIKLVCDCFGSEQFLMRILSWNVRGLGSKKKKGILTGLLRSQDPDNHERKLGQELFGHHLDGER